VLTPRTFQFERCATVYYEGGSAGRLPMLLMHGVGPGASVQGAFARIMPYLTRHFHVFAMDLAGFGGSAPKPAAPYFDFEFWTAQARALMDRMPAGPIVVFGHSLSGAIALRMTSASDRIAGVITTATVGTRYELNRDLARLWTWPSSRAELRESLRSLVHDIDAISDTVLDERWKILSVPGYGDHFRAMFAGDKQTLMDSWVLSESQLRSIAIPVTLVHGRDDLPCPADLTSLRLAQSIRHADVVLLARCGHAPSMEQPQKVIAAVELAFGGLQRMSETREVIPT